MATCEDRVAETLYEWLSNRPQCRVLSFHPPSGKAYSTDLLRIPKKLSGIRTRERFHIDLVFAEGPILFLAELKCRLSECYDDINKLREIRDSYRLNELLDLFERRVTTDFQIRDINTLILCLGVEVFDEESFPADFLVFCTGYIPPKIQAGHSVPSAATELFN